MEMPPGLDCQEQKTFLVDMFDGEEDCLSEEFVDASLDGSFDPDSSLGDVPINDCVNPPEATPLKTHDDDSPMETLEELSLPSKPDQAARHQAKLNQTEALSIIKPHLIPPEPPTIAFPLTSSIDCLIKTD